MKPLHPPSAPRHVSPRPVGAKRSAPHRPPHPFPAFIAYADLPAARRAMGVINGVLGVTAGRFDFKPMLWRFDQLASAKWCDYALTDATEAAVVVLASSTPGSLPPAIEQWISSLLNRKRGQSITIVALQGDEDAWTITIEAPHQAADVSTLLTAVASAKAA